MEEKFELQFDPKTIEHLGVKMYSTLPPALAELISNAYDADASEVVIKFFSKGGSPVSIQVTDNGTGMTSEDIQNKFLVIGRNRREEEGDTPSKKFNRLPTGKKGLGKLALFGLANLITVDTVRSGLRNRFHLDWDSLLGAKGTYHPKSDLVDAAENKENRTTIKLSSLKRKSAFDLEALADSLSRIFIVDNTFSISLIDESGKLIKVNNERRFSNIKSQFKWDVGELVKELGEPYSSLKGTLITSKTPIPPSFGQRGVTLFSRGKLVNAPEFFSNSTSSHFYQYLTGWISADFIDKVEGDVISTNRQSLTWEHPEMADFRQVLSKLVSRVNADWRKKKDAEKQRNIKESTGIDKDTWLSTMSDNVRSSAAKIFDALSDDEGVSDSHKPVIEALYELVPEYPDLHWRHLHKNLKERVTVFYKERMYGLAADQGARVYSELLRELSGSTDDGTKLSQLFSVNSGVPRIKIVDDLTDNTKLSMQEGQLHLTNGVMKGFRNPAAHKPMDKLVPEIFSDIDCLNVLSLISFLVTRLDNAEVNEVPPKAEKKKQA